MNSFGKGFATGFFKTLGGRMEKRMDTADDYFNKQIERAREVGLKMKGQTDQMVSTSVTTARQLEQMGVPKDIIMAIANQNPADLATFQAQVNEAAAAGLPIDQDFFNDFVQVSKDFKPSDEGWDSFFGRVYRPIAANAKADPESFQRDRKGSLISTFFGYDAMENARDKLGTTLISDGMTAEQLLAYGDDMMPNKPLGDGVVTYDYGELARRKQEQKGPDELSINDQMNIDKLYEETFEKFLKEKFTEFGVSRNALTPEQRAQVDAAVAEELIRRYPKAEEYIRIRTGGETPAEEITEEVLPPPPAGVTGEPEVPIVNPETLEEPAPTEAPVEAPNSGAQDFQLGAEGDALGNPLPPSAPPVEAPVEPPPEIEFQGEVFTYLRPGKDPAYSIYKRADGTPVKIKNSELQ